MHILVHTVFIQKPDSSPIIICGKMTRDPTMLAALITALRELSRELSLRNNQQISNKITFHHFGEYFLAMIHKKDLSAAIVTDPVEIPEISNIIELLSDLFKIFDLVIWQKLSDNEKELGMVPGELFRAYVHETINKIVYDPKWRNKVILSSFFVSSDAGLIAINYTLQSILSRLNSALGPKLTYSFLRKTLYPMKLQNVVQINLDKKKRRTTYTLLLTEYSEEAEGDIQNLANYCLRIIKKLQKTIHEKALKAFMIFE